LSGKRLLRVEHSSSVRWFIDVLWGNADLVSVLIGFRPIS
jgi:hypothetical protein